MKCHRQLNKNLFYHSYHFEYKWNNLVCQMNIINFVHQPEGLVVSISAIHRIEHYPEDEY